MSSTVSTVSTVSTILSISPFEAIVRTDGNIEVCSNWWPTQHMLEKAPGMPHPLCQLCANWLPDIEEIGNVQIPNAKQSGCGNDWPASKNH
jgi:hypothetical protein